LSKVTHFLDLLVESDRPQREEHHDTVNDVDQRKEGVPEESVEGAQNHPAPQGEEETADGQHQPQIQPSR